MLRSMLVGIDGTPSGEAALELGIRWASRFDALLVGVGVVDEPGLHGAEEILVGERFFEKINAELLDDLKREVDQALSRVARTCAERGVAFKPLERVGDPKTEIVTEAQRFDLILLGQRSHFRFGATSADDTLSRVLAACPRPVIAVPETIPDGQDVLVAYDGSLQASRALAAFVASGLGRDRSIDVLSIHSEHRQAALVADRAVEYLRSHELRSEPRVVTRSSRVAEAIAEQIPASNAGLLVMGAYGQSAVREFLLGSVTRSLLEHGPVPLFLFH